MTDFDLTLDLTLTHKANPAVPAALEQRLLARLHQAAPDNSPLNAREPQLFTTAQRMTPRRSLSSTWTALGLHAAAILLIVFLVAHQIRVTAPKQAEDATLIAPPPPVAPSQKSIGGGGGQHDTAPVTQGHLPKLAQTQMVPPKAPPTVTPKLAAEPTIVVQKDLQLADNHLPDIGAPNSTLKGFSMGNGSGSGIGSGNGAGFGPGTGGNIGGGVMHVGGSVLAPKVLFEVDPEFSEEARKAKFSGNVLVSLIIDQQGLPRDVHCVRDVGMGLCDKAVEAVRQYKFKPATQNGEPVKVDMNVAVDFQIF
jgi:protein TonB